MLTHKKLLLVKLSLDTWTKEGKKDFLANFDNPYNKWEALKYCLPRKLRNRITKYGTPDYKYKGGLHEILFDERS